MLVTLEMIIRPVSLVLSEIGGEAVMKETMVVKFGGCGNDGSRDGFGHHGSSEGGFGRCGGAGRGAAGGHGDVRNGAMLVMTETVVTRL